jgi:hypothetical protein
MSSPDTSPDTPTKTPLAHALGLTDDEIPLLEALFVESASKLGVDGNRVFEHLKRGRPLGSALEIPAGVIELLYARAHKWFAVGRVDAAEPLFRALCVLDGGSADYWVGYGVCLKERSAFDEAVVTLETAARLRPEWAVPQFHALELFMRREEWERAAAALAAFTAKTDAQTPTALIAEAERFRVALKLRAAGSESRAP